MGAEQGSVVDHINGDTLDNRKSNLRLCTNTENCRNAAKQKTANGNPCISQYKGVTKTKSTVNGRNYEYWRAQICVDNKMIHLGNHKTEEDAAVAYDRSAVKYFGDFANLNFGATA